MTDALKDRVDERREGFDRRREDQKQAGHTEKDGERDQPASMRFAAPKPARQVRDRSRRAGDDDRASMNASAFPDHATSSFRFVSNDPRFTTRVRPATRTSMPQRR